MGSFHTEPVETTLFLSKLKSKMARLAILIVSIFATAFGKPQVGLLNPWFPTSRIVTSYNYQRPLRILHPGMTQPNYFQGNSFLAPYTYPVNMVDANSDGKVTLAEMQDDNLDTDPRMAAVWNDIFSDLGGDEFQKKGVKSSSGDEYNEGFETALFSKNDANRDNNLNLIEFSKFVSDTFDLAIFFVQYDTDRDYHLDETEYANAEVWNSLGMSVAETLIGSDDRKLSLVETMQLISIMDALAGNTKNIPDLCARKRINKIGYIG